MAHIHLITPFVDKLNDMITIFGFHNTGHFLGVIEVERHIGELRHP